MVPELSLLGPSNHGNVAGLPQVVPQGEGAGGVDLAQVSVTRKGISLGNPLPICYSNRVSI